MGFRHGRWFEPAGLDRGVVVMRRFVRSLLNWGFDCCRATGSQRRLGAGCLASRFAFRDEEGMTTMSVVLSLLLTLSLIFSTAQVYRVNSISSRVQSVADAAALAAENVVAEFMIVVRLCDAVVLSLNLTSAAACGLGVVALCVPGGQSVGGKLLESSHRVAKARNEFSIRATSGLNKVQKALPFLCAVQAASTAAANGKDSPYVALAILVPEEVADIESPADDGSLDEALDTAESNASEIREQARQAEEAAQDAQRAKREAFEHDCGANPGYCMAERANTLAGMSGSENPIYSSADTWSFSVALARAKAYYPKRLAAEAPTGTSVEDQADSILRKRFYRYACEQINSGYVHESADSFEAYFPVLPKNTAEMLETPLATERIYPYTDDGSGGMKLHAWTGCPEAASVQGYACIKDFPENDYTPCKECQFSRSSMGKVAAASTSIDNGFEHHYGYVARAAEDYSKALERARPAKAEVKRRASSVFDAVGKALSQAARMRISARPPGSDGVVALCANTGQDAPAKGFESAFVQASGNLGARVAVSSATLVADPSGEGENVISSLTDGLADQGAAVGAAGVVLDLWSGMLKAYAGGQNAIEGAIRDGIGALPLVGPSGLGNWAADAFSSVVRGAGLEPANLDALRPVVVNTAHVAGAARDSAVCARLLELKRVAVENPLASNDPFSAIVSAVGRRGSQAIESSDGKIEVATFDLGEGGGSIPVTITLPQAAKDAAADAVGSAADALIGIHSSLTGAVPWD